MDDILPIVGNLMLFALVFLLFASLFVYMILSIVDEDENYEIDLLQVDGESYLVVKEKQNNQN